MKQRVTVRVTATFERNLAGIHDFLVEAGAATSFDELVDRLSAQVVPNLERFPRMGADFLGRAPLSAEGQALFDQAIRLAGPEGELRQLIDRNYVILYLLQDRSIQLLSIRHQRQLSFDFIGHWP